jgi:hypothetical protein
MKAKCTQNKGGRRITRWVHEHILERVQANPELMRKRKQIVEHLSGLMNYPAASCRVVHSIQLKKNRNYTIFMEGFYKFENA